MAPFLLLTALLVWGWQSFSLGRAVAAYGDTMEFMWSLSWYADAFRSGQGIQVYPLAFYPAGWHYAENLLMLVALLPLVWISGPAFAYNTAVLLSFVGAFTGAYLLARRFLAQFAAAIAAVLVTFAGYRWFHQLGHINILIGSALIPWVLLALDRALNTRARRVILLIAAGVLWSASMSGSMYFAYLTGLAVFCWIAGYLAARRITWRVAAAALVIPAAVALLLSLPGIIWLWKQSGETGVGFYTPGEVNFWGASFNALPLPSIDHPWFGDWVRRVYRGIPFEQGATNFGLLAVVLALAGAAVAAKSARWRPVLILAIAGVALSLGLTLKWNDVTLQWNAMRPLDTVLWQMGHVVKPSFFASQPPAPFDAAIPMPGMLLAALVPFLERARVFARFALAGGVAVFLLTAFGLSRVPNRWLQLGLATLLIVEVLPAPLQGHPFPPEPHPAYVWLSQQSLPGGSVADMAAGHPYTPVLFNEGEAVWATRIHGQPTVAGASSIWPAHTMYLFQWLATHEHAFWHPHLAPLLRFYDVRYILLHMRGESERGILEEARQNPEIRPGECFDPPATDGPWPYPICVLEVMPPPNPGLNLLFEDGWSGAESWGVWAEGATSQATWVATEEAPYFLQVEAFPVCSEDRRQQVSVEVNGQRVVEHAWTGCETWAAEGIEIPASLVRVGGNALVVRSRFAASPNELSQGENPDTRELSVGFTKLRVER